MGIPIAGPAIDFEGLWLWGFLGVLGVLAVNNIPVAAPFQINFSLV
jgi:hypothetical protein